MTAFFFSSLLRPLAIAAILSGVAGFAACEFDTLPAPDDPGSPDDPDDPDHPDDPEPGDITILAVSPSAGGGLVGTTEEFALLASEPPSTYAWDFGPGAEPPSSDLAAPMVTLAEEGIHTGSVMVTGPRGTSVAYPFTYWVRRSLPKGDWRPGWALNGSTALYRRALQVGVYSNRVIAAYSALEDGRLKVAAQRFSRLSTLDPWPVTTLPAPGPGYVTDLSITADSLALAGGLWSGEIAFAVVPAATFDQPSTWSLATIPQLKAGSGTSLAFHDGEWVALYADSTGDRMRGIPTLARQTATGWESQSLGLGETNIRWDLGLASIGDTLWATYPVIEGTDAPLHVAALHPGDADPVGTHHTIASTASHTKLGARHGLPLVLYLGRPEATDPAGHYLAQPLFGVPTSPNDWRISYVAGTELDTPMLAASAEHVYLLALSSIMPVHMRFLESAVGDPSGPADWLTTGAIGEVGDSTGVDLIIVEGRPAAAFTNGAGQLQVHRWFEAPTL